MAGKTSNYGANYGGGDLTTSTQTVPGGLDVVLQCIEVSLRAKHINNDEHTGDPVVDGHIVLFGVFDIIVDFVGVIRFPGFVPCTHVNADSEAVRKQLLRGLDINVLGGSGGSGMEVGVVRSKLATEGYGTVKKLFKGSLQHTPSMRRATSRVFL